MGDHRVQGSPFWRTLGFSKRRRWVGQEILGICVCAQSWPTLYDPMDCKPPCSSVLGIFQARILKRMECHFLLLGISPPRDRTRVSCLLHWQVDTLLLSRLGSPGYLWCPTKFFFLSIHCSVELLRSSPLEGKMILFRWSDSLVSSVLGSEANVGLRETFPTLWLNIKKFFSVCTCMGFSGGAGGKEPACQCRRHKRCGFNPWVRKIPWRRAWQPTPIFSPRESHGAWWATVHRVSKIWTRLRWLSRRVSLLNS